VNDQSTGDALKLGKAIQSFKEGAASPHNGLSFLVKKWSSQDWESMFGSTEISHVAAGQALIRNNEVGRTLFFVLRGNFEVFVQSADEESLASIWRGGAGSVFGELAFFDGNERSASVWAVEDCAVAAMTIEKYTAFQLAHQGLALDLITGLGRVLASRLRRANIKVAF
jgi:CRP-like cAMP-binding protein